MKLLAISGSGRTTSTNTAMLRAIADIARPDHQITVFTGVTDLPIFSPDLESAALPKAVREFVDLISRNDGIIISSPEYVRAIPGGLKNAIDWLVSRDEIVRKPVALAHASHRGDDMLMQLRLVLNTVTQRFADDVFLRFELMKMAPDEITGRLAEPSNRAVVNEFLDSLTRYCTQ